MVGASYRVKTVGDRQYVPLGTLHMNRHLMKGFDDPVSSQLYIQTLRKDRQLKEQELSLLSLWCLCLCYMLQLGAAVMTVSSHVPASLLKKPTMSPVLCGIALLHVLVVRSELNAQEKPPISPLNSLYLKTREEIRSRKNPRWLITDWLPFIAFSLHGS